MDGTERSKVQLPPRKDHGLTLTVSSRGIPLYLFEIRHLDSKTVNNYEKSANETYSKAHTDGNTPPKLLRLFALYENLTRFVQPLCTQMPDRDSAQTPITLSTNIVDVSGVSLRQFWNLKSHMQAASTLATAHYPETLDRKSPTLSPPTLLTTSPGIFVSCGVTSKKSDLLPNGI
jgi:hypothetical protein